MPRQIRKTFVYYSCGWLFSSSFLTSALYLRTEKPSNETFRFNFFSHSTAGFDLSPPDLPEPRPFVEIKKGFDVGAAGGKHVRLECFRRSSSALLSFALAHSLNTFQHASSLNSSSQSFAQFASSRVSFKFAKSNGKHSKYLSLVGFK